MEAHSSAYAMNEGNEDTVVINTVTVSETGVIWIKPVVNGEKVAMQLGTGSALTIMSKEYFQKLFVGEKLTKTTAVMKTFSGEKLKSLGYAIVKVCLNNQTLKLELRVVDVKAPLLFGRDWLCSLYDQNDVLNVFKLNAEMHDNALSKFLNQYEAFFENALGKLNNITGKLYLKNDAKPVFCKARSLPYALKVKVKAELVRLQEMGIVEPVS